MLAGRRNGRLASDLPPNIVRRSRSCRFIPRHPVPPSLETSELPKAALFKYRREVGLGNVVGEGAVAENHRRFSGGSQRLVPLRNAFPKRLNVLSGDRLVKTRHKGTYADRVHGLICDTTHFNSNAEIETEFQKQLGEDVLFGTSRFNVVEPSKQ